MKRFRRTARALPTTAICTTTLSALALFPAASASTSLPTVGPAGLGPGGAFNIDLRASNEPDGAQTYASRERVVDSVLLRRAQLTEDRISKAAGFPRMVVVKGDPSDVVNAWTDGEKIWVTSGMLRFVRDDDELAAVLGHESGHIKAGHPKKIELASIAGVLGSVIAEALGGRNVGLGAYIGATLAVKKYSRDEEAQADRIGMALMETAGYNGAAMPRLFDDMAGLEASDPALFSSFLEDHPSDSERIRRVNGYTQLDPEKVDNQKRFLRGLVARGAPYQAALLARTLSEQHPSDPDLQQLSLETARGVSLTGCKPLVAATDLNLVPKSILDPPGPRAPLKNLARPEEQLRRSASGLFSIIYSLQGLAIRSADRDELADADGVIRRHADLNWQYLMQRAWKATSTLGESLDPAGGASAATERALELEFATRNFPSRTAEIGDQPLLKASNEERSRAEADLKQAVADVTDASDACAHDTLEISRGIAAMIEENSRVHSEGAEPLPVGMEASWFGTGSGGVSLIAARSALQEAATAEIRLQVAVLNWQGRHLAPAAKSSILRQIRTWLILDAHTGAEARTCEDAPLGTTLLQLAVEARGLELAGRGEATGASPALVFTPVAGVDGIGLLAAGHDMDGLEDLYRPAFTEIEREMSASVALAVHGVSGGAARDKTGADS